MTKLQLLLLCQSIIIVMVCIVCIYIIIIIIIIVLRRDVVATPRGEGYVSKQSTLQFYAFLKNKPSFLSYFIKFIMNSRGF